MEIPCASIVVEINEQHGHIMVSVADTGIGLPAERERLTEPYMTTRARGTGLGLAIVKNIIEEHLATIAFGDRPGGGTIVTVGFDVDALAQLGETATDSPEPISDRRD